jgi:hypothetical protein
MSAFDLPSAVQCPAATPSNDLAFAFGKKEGKESQPHLGMHADLS